MLWSPIRQHRKFWGRFLYNQRVFCLECTGQGNDFEMIPTVKMETRHPIEESFGNEFSFIYILIFAELWLPEVTRRCQKFQVLQKMTSYGENFQNCVRINVLWSNLVKLAHEKSVILCVAYLTKNFAWLSSSHYCTDRVQNLPGPAPDNVLRVLQISSITFHFSAGVIPKHVNTIKTGCKVFPIFG